MQALAVTTPVPRLRLLAAAARPAMVVGLLHGDEGWERVDCWGLGLEPLDAAEEAVPWTEVETAAAVEVEPSPPEEPAEPVEGPPGAGPDADADVVSFCLGIVDIGRNCPERRSCRFCCCGCFVVELVVELLVS